MFSKLNSALVTTFLVALSATATAAPRIKMVFNQDGFYDQGWPTSQKLDCATRQIAEISGDSIGGMENSTSFLHLASGAKELLHLKDGLDRGWPTTAGAFFALVDNDPVFGFETGSTAIDVSSLPTARQSAVLPLPSPGNTVIPQTAAHPDRASVFLISVDSSSPEYLALYPVHVDFNQPNFDGKLSVVPLQGTPLRPNTLYAVVITSRVTVNGGTPLAHSPAADRLFTALPDMYTDSAVAGTDLEGITPCAYADYRQAAKALKEGDSSHSGLGAYRGADIWPSIAAFTVFRTGDPTAAFQAAVTDVLSNPTHEPVVSQGWGTGSTTFLLDDLVPSMYLEEYPDYGCGPLGECPPDSFPTIERGAMLGEYCVYDAHISLPLFQSDRRPFGYKEDFNHGERSGSWQFDAAGNPVFQHLDDPSFTNGRLGRLYVTVPRKPMSAAGYPVAMFAREGGGGDLPLITRGKSESAPLYSGVGEAGEGPALYFARAGFAGVQVDDPLGGIRRPGWSITEEDGLIFNVYNVWALRDNIRQMALELAVVGGTVLEKIGDGVSGITLDASACTQVECTYDRSTHPWKRHCGDTHIPGPSNVKFDLSHLTLMAHSVGATVAPLALAARDLGGEPIFKAGILSGAAGSYTNEALFKELPLLGPYPIHVHNETDMRGVLQSGIELSRGIVGTNDPVINVFQAAVEPADPPVYNRITNRSFAGELGGPIASQHVLQFQGIIDHYIEPPISNAAVLSMGLSLGISATDIAHGYEYGYDKYNVFTGFNPYDDHDGHECLSDSHCMEPATNYRAYMPLHDFLSYGGWAYNNTTSLIRSLPQRGRSLVVQNLNTDLILYHGTLPLPLPTCTAEGAPIACPSETGPDREDGHELVFQTMQPKLQYQCFLASSLLGEPIIAEKFTGIGVNPQKGDCCDHPASMTGVALFDNCSLCAHAVCAAQPSCCSTAWDATCVTKATELCGADPW